MSLLAESTATPFSHRDSESTATPFSPRDSESTATLFSHRDSESTATPFSPRDSESTQKADMTVKAMVKDNASDSARVGEGDVRLLFPRVTSVKTLP